MSATPASPGATAVPGEGVGFTDQVVARMRVLATGLPEPLRAPVHALAERPGKCLRSTLMAACAGFGTPDPERLVRLGALVELLHVASLLHDDVIDRAATRRGAPAAHRVVGDELALLAGLSCFALAGAEAAELGGGVDRAVSRTSAGLAYGEILDVERAFDTGLALDDYIELVTRKTGDLFRLTCVLGGADAGAPRPVTEALGRFGSAFGVAFQVLDDCLDLGDAGHGKPVGTDHLLGLFGAPALAALRRDDDGELAALLLSPSLGRDDLGTVRALIIERDGLADARRLARDWHGRSIDALDALPPGEARARLTATAAAIWALPA